jgi:hypothetical protein
MTALCLLVLGCSGERVQNIISTPSPDRSHVAVVRDLLAEETTGSVPQLFILPAGVQKPAQQWHVIDGPFNGTFAASWVSSTRLLVQYTLGEDVAQIPATMSAVGVTISFQQLQ